MTALNWEAQRRIRVTTDMSTDFPPLTGSFADQRRYGVFNGNRSRSQQPSSCITRNRASDHAELKRYADHVSHPDFKRKSSIQRTELLEILLKLTRRCQQWGEPATETERHIRTVAQLSYSSRTH